MPQNLRGRRPSRFGHNLLIRGGLRAYALTLPLLEFKCTWYEIKSRDMNEKGKDFIFYKLKCCEFKGKQASKIESTSLCCRSYSVLHVRD